MFNELFFIGYFQRCGAKMQEAADDLVSLYKRVSLDDDLDDALRSELLSQLSAGLPYPIPSTFLSSISG